MGLWGDIAYGLMAVLIGVVVSYAVFFFLDKAVNLLPKKAQEKLRYLAFILPAAALVIVVLLYPLIDTIVLSFFNEYSNKFVGFKNYAELFTSETFFGILLNNFLWLAFVPAVTVGIGLLFANLTNRMGPGRERIFKSLVFMPMSISFISAGTIWKLFYVSVPPGRPEIGLFNSIITSLGGQPQNLLANDTWHLNSFLLMIIVIWLQAGFSMVLLSSAIKAVPEETIEAAKIDGARTGQVFWKIIFPQIRGTVMAVFITVLILVMKIFDIILAMTRGDHNTSVLAMAFYDEFVVKDDSGMAAAIVCVLLVLIAPLMWLQIRTVKQQEELR
jgi:alpha-glucoside transport system permease protein